MVAGFSLHNELELLVQVGLSPEEALAAATRLPAQWLSAEKLIGTVEAGKRADIVLLESNPLDDITVTRKIEAVIINGKWMHKNILRQKLSELSKRNSAMKD